MHAEVLHAVRWLLHVPEGPCSIGHTWHSEAARGPEAGRGVQVPVAAVTGSGCMRMHVHVRRCWYGGGKGRATPGHNELLLPPIQEGLLQAMQSEQCRVGQANSRHAFGT